MPSRKPPSGALLACRSGEGLPPPGSLLVAESRPPEGAGCAGTTPPLPGSDVAISCSLGRGSAPPPDLELPARNAHVQYSRILALLLPAWCSFDAFQWTIIHRCTCSGFQGFNTASSSLVVGQCFQVNHHTSMHMFRIARISALFLPVWWSGDAFE